MSEHHAGPGGWTAVQADPGAAVEGAPVEVLEVPEPQQAQHIGQSALRPVLPMGWQKRVEPVAEAQAAVAAPAAPAEAAVLTLAEPPENEPPPEQPAPPRLGPVSPPLRIIAAIVGVALGAVPFTMATTKAAPVPAPQPHVAHFQVKDRDVPIFWKPNQ